MHTPHFNHFMSACNTVGFPQALHQTRKCSNDPVISAFTARLPDYISTLIQYGRCNLELNSIASCMMHNGYLIYM